MAGGSSSSWGPSPAAVTPLVALLELGVAAYIVGPPLYWHVAEAFGRSAGGCPACACDCDALQLPQDCAKQFKEVKSGASSEETELLIQELKQREEEATEAQQQADVILLEAKKTSFAVKRRLTNAVQVWIHVKKLGKSRQSRCSVKGN